MGKRGIAPTFKKNVLNLFVCIKLYLFLTVFLSLSDIFPFGVYCGDNFKKVGTHQCGCNTK